MTTNSTETFNEGDMRVWWQNSHSRDTDHRVSNPKEAGELLQSFAARDLADDSVAWNTGGLQVLEDGAWMEWYSDDGMDIWEYIEENHIEMPAVKVELDTAPEITSTSTLTEVFAALDAQGIYAHRAASQGPDAKGIEYWAGQGKTGIAFFTSEALETWEDTRFLTITTLSVTSEDKPWYEQETAHYRINREVRRMVELAGFGITQDYPLTIHVPKSRF